jgi:uncharacterized protein
MQSAALAFSGGADSALLAFLAQQELGENFLAVTLRSALMQDGDLADVARFCKEHNIAHAFLDMDILNNEAFAANCSDRCYHCKVAIFSAVKECADARHLKQVMDGTNIEDCPKRRPGMRVLSEKGIRSPLRENNFSKEEVRRASQAFGLFTWDKVSDSCLATRLEQGERITAEKLRKLR